MSSFRKSGQESDGVAGVNVQCEVVNLLSSDEEEKDINSADNHGESARKKPRLMTQKDLQKQDQISIGSNMQLPAHEETVLSPTKADGDASRRDDDGDEDLEVVSCVLAARTPRSNSTTAHARSSAEIGAASKLGVFSPTEQRRHGRRSARERAHSSGNDSGSALTRRRNSERGGSAGGAEQLQVVDCRRGVNALIDYAHFRFHCATKPFKRRQRAARLEHCHKCFCYVCDDPVEKCVSWQTHYEATDSVVYWKNLRDECLHARRKQTVDLAQAGSQFARVEQPVAISLLEIDSDNDRRSDREATESGVRNSADECDGDDERASVGSVDDMLWYDTDDVNDVIRDASVQLEEVRLSPDTFSMAALASLLDASRTVHRSSAERLVAQPYDPAIFD